MTPDEQIVAIAEMCPFVFQDEERCYRWYPLGPTASDDPFSPLTDLNAIRQAVMALTKKRRRKVYALLASNSNGIFYEIEEEAIDDDCCWSINALEELGEAPAELWSEAFLRAVGKWKE